jgi:hypothetical protein
MRCLARDTKLEALEQRDRVALARPRIRAAKPRAEKLLDWVRDVQRDCTACGQPLSTNRGVLFQGDHLVHATCWQAEPKPAADLPPAG